MADLETVILEILEKHDHYSPQGGGFNSYGAADELAKYFGDELQRIMDYVHSRKSLVRQMKDEGTFHEP